MMCEERSSRKSFCEETRLLLVSIKSIHLQSRIMQMNHGTEEVV